MLNSMENKDYLMKKILFTLVASATLFSNTLLAADEETFINPRVTTTDGKNIAVSASAGGAFCLRNGYGNTSGGDVIEVENQEGSLYVAIPTNDFSATAPWYSLTGPRMAYFANITCSVTDIVFVSPTITVSGYTVPIAEKTKLNGWETDSVDIACSDKGYAPVSQSLTSLSVGLYAEFDVFSTSGGWTLLFKPDDGTTINVLSSMTCKG